MKRVYLEICNACNLDCPFCTYKKGNDYLSYEEITDYLSQIKPYCNYIYLHVLGEPLLHPDFNRILNYLDDLDMDLQLVSNGTLLNKYPDILNHKCLRKLSVSLHSINTINISDDYFINVNKLIENNNDKYIELRFFDYDNLSKRLKDYLNELKDKYNFVITSHDNSYRLKENVYVKFAEMFDWPDINAEIVSKEGYCHGAIDMIAINANSEVTICCLDPLAYNSIGNLKKESLKQILEGNLYQQYLQDIKNHHLTSELCKRCTYRLRFK